MVHTLLYQRTRWAVLTSGLEDVYFEQRYYPLYILQPFQHVNFFYVKWHYGFRRCGCLLRRYVDLALPLSETYAIVLPILLDISKPWPWSAQQDRIITHRKLSLTKRVLTTFQNVVINEIDNPLYIAQLLRHLDNHMLPCIVGSYGFVPIPNIIGFPKSYH